jgi:curved DNA-binding protein CbpA
MIDYFALLDQPRRPWLDPENLKETYHQKSLRTHPDVHAESPGAAATDTAFASLNQAYQVLLDPKQRLHHLMSLEGAAPSSSDQAVPSQLEDLFPKIGDLTRRANLLMEKIRATSNALGRSLLKPQILEVQKEAKEVRATIKGLTDVSLDRLRQISVAWEKNPAQQLEGLSNLYFAFAYLTRWSKQLDEMAFQLSLL